LKFGVAVRAEKYKPEISRTLKFMGCRVHTHAPVRENRLMIQLFNAKSHLDQCIVSPRDKTEILPNFQKLHLLWRRLMAQKES